MADIYLRMAFCCYWTGCFRNGKGYHTRTMLTLFTTGKPFTGHSGVIQRNALASWRRLHPNVEVILFGDETGTAEVSRELGLRHEPRVERSASGMKYLDYMFRRAQEVARNDLLSYVNCDILLLSDYRRALERVAKKHDRFLMVGQRWDTNITEPVDFTKPDWEQKLLGLAREKGVRQSTYMVDYFTFKRGLYADMPRLVVGRMWWDHWLVWRARASGADVVDVSKVVTAVHQNHDYGYHAKGYQGVNDDPESHRNRELAGGLWHLYTIADATHSLRTSGESRNWAAGLAPYRRHYTLKWFTVLDWTRPVRHAIGLRKRKK